MDDEKKETPMAMAMWQKDELIPGLANGEEEVCYALLLNCDWREKPLSLENMKDQELIWRYEVRRWDGRRAVSVAWASEYWRKDGDPEWKRERSRLAEYLTENHEGLCPYGWATDPAASLLRVEDRAAAGS